MRRTSFGLGLGVAGPEEALSAGAEQAGRLEPLLVGLGEGAGAAGDVLLQISTGGSVTGQHGSPLRLTKQAGHITIHISDVAIQLRS